DPFHHPYLLSFPTRRSSDLFHGAAFLIKTRNQEVVQLVRFDAENRLLFCDQALFHHLDGDANGGESGALAVSGLQHVELAILNRSEEHTSELQSPCNLVCRL